jgi:hypothetical protein
MSWEGELARLEAPGGYGRGMNTPYLGEAIRLDHMVPVLGQRSPTWASNLASRAEFSGSHGINKLLGPRRTKQLDLWFVVF